MATREEPKPNGEPKPKPLHQVEPRLIQLYHAVGQIIGLQKAVKSKGIMIDGDLEVVYSDELKAKINERVQAKLATVAGLVAELRKDQDEEAEKV